MSNEAQRFRKKPVEVEAVQFTRESGPAVWEWAKSKPKYDAFGNVYALRIYTLHGDATAEFGDWVVRGPSGDFWPVKPDIFDETYEPVDSQRLGGVS